eukprot:Lithocolla_globosa_v1_NODE_984_length_2990_cov_16.633731.p4 type:complete len:101 gc:universal NODE_984_length_2990_cov_16.633731:1974-2276(+)
MLWNILCVFATVIKGVTAFFLVSSIWMDLQAANTFDKMNNVGGWQRLLFIIATTNCCFLDSNGFMENEPGKYSTRPKPHSRGRSVGPRTNHVKSISQPQL